MQGAECKEITAQADRRRTVEKKVRKEKVKVVITA